MLGLFNRNSFSAQHSKYQYSIFLMSGFVNTYKWSVQHQFLRGHCCSKNFAVGAEFGGDIFPSQCHGGWAPLPPLLGFLVQYFKNTFSQKLFFPTIVLYFLYLLPSWQTASPVSYSLKRARHHLTYATWSFYPHLRYWCLGFMGFAPPL